MSNNPTPFEREKISPHLKKGKRKKQRRWMWIEKRLGILTTPFWENKKMEWNGSDPCQERWWSLLVLSLVPSYSDRPRFSPQGTCISTPNGINKCIVFIMILFLFQNMWMIRTIPAESHGDGAGSNFGNAGGEDDRGGGTGTWQASSEGEGDSEAVGDADDDVTHNLTGHEMLLLMLMQKQLLLLHVRASIFRHGPALASFLL